MVRPTEHPYESEDWPPFLLDDPDPPPWIRSADPVSPPPVLAVREAAGSGTTLRRLRGPKGQRYLHGIYSPQRRSLGPDALHASLLRAATVTGQDVASHRSAAWLWGFPDVSPPRELELLSRGGDRRRRVQGMSGRRGLVLPEETTIHRGIPVTTPARTWLDLAGSVSLLQLVIWADWLFNPVWGGNWDRPALSTPEEIRRLLAGHRGKPGIRLARLAADRARVGSDSPKETGLRLALVDAGLPEPAVNQWILDPLTGERVHRGDLTYEEYRLTLEYEGRHHSDPDQVARDIDRQERLEAADWSEIRFSDRHARNGWRRAIEKTRSALAIRGWSP
jgi:hypothetical protein